MKERHTTDHANSKYVQREGFVQWETMTPIHPSFQQLLPLIFPSELLTYFEITEMKETRHPKTDDITIHITLEEKNTPPVIPEEEPWTLTYVIPAWFPTRTEAVQSAVAPS